MRLTILAAVLLLVAGCYESDGLLLDPAAARQPVATGRDWIYGSTGQRIHALLTAKPDGWYDYAEARLDAQGRNGPWKHYTVVLNHLASAAGYEIFVYGTYNSDDSAYMYGLVVVGQDGFWQSVQPSCNPAAAEARWFEPDIAAAKAAGARIKAIDELESVCRFTTREQLFAAMRTVIAAPGFWDRVKSPRNGQPV